MRDLAVCLVGQLRGVCEWKDLRSFFEVFLASFHSTDVFLTVTEEECGRAHEFARLAEFDLKPIGLDVNLIPVCLAEELQEPADVRWLEEFPNSPAGSKYYAQSKLRSLLLPPKHMKLCGARASDQAARVGGYRWGARVRPDCLWHSFPSRDEIAKLAPPQVLANFVPLPIQAVTEDQFLLAEWSQMQAIFSGFYDFLSNSTRSWGFDLYPPWCVVHATMRSDSFCQELFPENFLEMLLRRELGFQQRKVRSICFDRIAPCNLPRTDYCNHLYPPRHAHGFYFSDSQFYDQFGRDYFLTAPGIYADLDGQLAARLARFFHDEVGLLGPSRPPKILDVGCGRGSYVEAFLQWGLIAIGVDGDAVVRRTLPAHGFLWDLTEEISLANSLATARDDLCDFEPLIIKHPQYFVGLLPVQPGKLPPAVQERIMRHFCCNDLRCIGFTLEDGLGLLWGLSTAAWPDLPVLPALQVGDVMFTRVDEGVLQLTSATPDQARDSVRHLGVRFQQADWVLSLGVGQHIPRDSEAAFVGNIVRHATSGVVLSWGEGDVEGSKTANPRTRAEVKRIFEAEGFKEDVAASEEIRLFSGLGYGGPRNDLLVLRRAKSLPRLPPRPEPQLSLEAAQVMGYRSCELGVTFGLLPGASPEVAQMWTSQGCRGLFVLEQKGRNGFEVAQICMSPMSDYQECYFPLKSKKQNEKKTQETASSLGAALPACTVPRLCFMHNYWDDHSYDSHTAKWHGSADHFVPVRRVWRGQPQLNMVYFKFARWLITSIQGEATCDSPRACSQIPDPSAGRSFRLEWNWFWASDWKHWLRDCPGRSCSRIYEILLVLPSLAERHPAPACCKKELRPGQRFRWLSVQQKLRKAMRAAKHWSEAILVPNTATAPTPTAFAAASPEIELRRSECHFFRRHQSQKASAWRRVAILQSALAGRLTSARPAKLLRSPTFVSKILPGLQRLLRSLSESSAAGRHCRYWPFQKFPKSARRGREYSAESSKASWEPNADDAHYLYRLAALDIDHV